MCRAVTTALQGDSLPCWLWRSEPLMFWAASGESHVARNWEKPLADSQQEPGALILTVCRELNSANNHISLGILPQMNPWWTPSSGRHLDFSLAEDLVKPQDSPSAGAWVSMGSHSALTSARPRIGEELTPVELLQKSKGNVASSFRNASCKQSRCQLQIAFLHWPSLFCYFNCPIPDPQKPCDSN